jgi:hypothetical protein
VKEQPLAPVSVCQRVVLSIHIPKCAGTSFRHVLTEIYGREGVWLNYDETAPIRFDLIPPTVRCIHGHFPASHYDRFISQPELVTWFRHPVDRVVSTYYQFSRHPDRANPCCCELLDKGLSLEEFAALDLMRNEATRYLGGKPIEAFKFVGIVERFWESLKVFGATFGVPIPQEPPRENVNPERQTERYPISLRQYGRILEMNLQDLAAYDMAASRIDQRSV